MNLFELIRRRVSLEDVITSIKCLGEEDGKYKFTDIGNNKKSSKRCIITEYKFERGHALPHQFEIDVDKRIFFCRDHDKVCCHGDIFSVLNKVKKMTPYDISQYLIEEYKLDDLKGLDIHGK